MQSTSEKSSVELEAYDDLNERTSAMKMYELYSGTNITEAIRHRRDNYDKADHETKMNIKKNVDIEVKGFVTWLEETKNLSPLAAHGYAVSLKTLLLGLPIGVSVAKLFGAILDKPLTNSAASALNKR
jgi:hypothetical protein